MGGIQQESVVASTARIGSLSAIAMNSINNGVDEERFTTSFGMDNDDDDNNERSNHDHNNNNSYYCYDDDDGNDHETTVMASSSSAILPLHSTIIDDSLYGHRNSLSKRSHHPTIVGTANGAGSSSSSSSSSRPVVYRTEAHHQSRDDSSIGNTNTRINGGAAGSLLMTPPSTSAKSGRYVVGPTRANNMSGPLSTPAASNNNTMKTPRKGSLHSNVGGGTAPVAAGSTPSKPTTSSSWLKDGRKKRPFGLPSFTLTLVVVMALSCSSYLYTAVYLMNASSTTEPATNTDAGSVEDSPFQLNPGQNPDGGHSDIDSGPKKKPKKDNPKKASHPSFGIPDEGGKKKTPKPWPQKTDPLPTKTATLTHPISSSASSSSSFPRTVIVAGQMGSQLLHEYNNDIGGETLRRRPPRFILAVPSSHLEPPLPHMAAANSEHSYNGTTTFTNHSTVHLREFELSDVPLLFAEGGDDPTNQEAEKLGAPLDEPTPTSGNDATTPNNGTRPVEDHPEQLPDDETKESKSCLPMAEWMKASYLNCNSIHELDMGESALQKDQTDLVLLGEGWFRSTWKYSTGVFSGDQSSATSSPTSTTSSTVVLKTLRIEREFLEEYFELHRRDAVAMERLTFSPYVMDVYGYCGQSAINELAEGLAGGTVNSLEQLDRKMRGKDSDERFLFLKLQLATSIATGLAHVHNVRVENDNRYGGTAPSPARHLIDHYDDGSHPRNGGSSASTVATLAHYDINPRNIAIMRDGRPKLNDFNIAEFLTYDPATNRSCGFRSRLHEPWWRAPEEMDLSHTTTVTEKVDVYALGNVLFHILTTHSPRGKMKKERMDEVRHHVRSGERPQMLEPYASNPPGFKKHRIVKAFTKALDLCYEMDPRKRGTALDVANVLQKALKQEEKEQAKEERRGKNKPPPEGQGGNKTSSRTK